MAIPAQSGVNVFAVKNWEMPTHPPVESKEVPGDLQMDSARKPG